MYVCTYRILNGRHPSPPQDYVPHAKAFGNERNGPKSKLFCWFLSQSLVTTSAHTHVYRNLLFESEIKTGL